MRRLRLLLQVYVILRKIPANSDLIDNQIKIEVVQRLLETIEVPSDLRRDLCDVSDALTEFTVAYGAYLRPELKYGDNLDKE